MTGDRNTQSERMYQEMIEANPEVLLLVEDLDLVNPETGLRYGEKPAPQVSEDKRQRLSSIAEGLLNRGRIYTCEQVLSLIEGRLNISRQRAVNGFEMMMTSGVLIGTTGNGIRLSM